MESTTDNSSYSDNDDENYIKRPTAEQLIASDDKSPVYIRIAKVSLFLLKYISIFICIIRFHLYYMLTTSGIYNIIKGCIFNHVGNHGTSCSIFYC